MKCPRCGYEWKSKIPQPKECPRCKGRMDYLGAVGAPRIKKGGEKEMTSKLPWATVSVVIIIVAAIGAWAIFGGAPAAPPAAPGWTAVLGLIGNVGIENIYLMDNTKTYSLNGDLSGHENILEYEGQDVVITGTGLTENIPYGAGFDFVVAIRIPSENVANLAVENIKVELEATGAISLSADNSTDAEEQIFDSGDPYRINVLLTEWQDLVLSAGESFDFTAKVWVWV